MQATQPGVLKRGQSMAEAQLNVSVLVLTKNEQSDLAGCLESVPWCNDIHVFDSGSTDATISIAERFGATVTQRTYPQSDAPFGGDEAAHRTWGLRHIPFKHEWVLLLDADERATPELMAEISDLLACGSSFDAYRICRRDTSWGRGSSMSRPHPCTSGYSSHRQCTTSG